MIKLDFWRQRAEGYRWRKGPEMPSLTKKENLGRLLLALRVLFAGFLIWRTVPLIPSYETVAQDHNVPGVLILLIALWEITAAILFIFPRTILWGAVGLLGVFLLAAGISIHAGMGFFQLVIYSLIVIALAAAERRRAG